jgi:hypothetical protein
MMERVCSQVPRLLRVPGSASHRYPLQCSIGCSGWLSRSAWLVRTHGPQATLYGGGAGLLQLLEQSGGGYQFLVGSEMLRHPDQVRGEPFGTGVVQTG